MKRDSFAIAWTVVLLALAGCGSSGNGGGAPAFVPTDPSLAGRYGVEEGTTELTVPDFGTYPALTYKPVALSPEDEAPPSHIPGVVLSNGLFAIGPWMSWISRHVASHGYAVLTFTPANPASLDMTTWAAGFWSGIDALLGESADSSGSLEGIVDPERIGLVALSAGGAGAIQAAGSDPRVGAVVAFAPGINDIGRFFFQDVIDAAANVTAPTQIQLGTEDCLVNPKPPSLLAFTNLGRTGVETYYDAIPGRRQFLEIQGANHIDFVDDPIATVGGDLIIDVIPIDCAATIPVEDQHTIARKYTTMWLDTYLYDTDAWQEGLFGSGVADDLAAGTLTRVRSDPPA